jgi:hypothetical protein
MTHEKVSSAARRTARVLFRVAGAKDGRRAVDLRPEALDRLETGLFAAYWLAMEMEAGRDARYLRRLRTWAYRQAERAYEARFNRRAA